MRAAAGPGTGLAAVFYLSQLFQHRADVLPDADGAVGDLPGRIGFLKVDAGINRLGILRCHSPEGKFHYAGGVMFIAHHFEINLNLALQLCLDIRQQIPSICILHRSYSNIRASSFCFTILC